MGMFDTRLADILISEQTNMIGFIPLFQHCLGSIITLATVMKYKGKNNVIIPAKDPCQSSRQIL